MTLHGRRICTCFPDTVLEEHASLRDKTVKLGVIARTCSVYGVDNVTIFRDPRGRGESRLIKLILEYLETPQYLRRRLFPIDDSLRFAGTLPPLRIPSHKSRVKVEELRPGEYREGVVLADGRSVDVGLDGPLQLGQASGANKRVTIKVTSASPLRGVISDRSEPREYWGYEVGVKGLDEVLTDTRFSLKIATSRLGDPLTRVLPSLQDRLTRAKEVMLLFGSPSRGLFQLAGKKAREKTSFMINLYPEQHVATVRTEEAMSSALYLMEVLGALGDAKV